MEQGGTRGAETKRERASCRSAKGKAVEERKLTDNGTKSLPVLFVGTTVRDEEVEDQKRHENEETNSAGLIAADTEKNIFEIMCGHASAQMHANVYIRGHAYVHSLTHISQKTDIEVIQRIIY